MYERRIYRYLTNPIEGLHNIKDEDILVAYRLPIGHEKHMRLEILHRRADRLVYASPMVCDSILLMHPPMVCDSRQYRVLVSPLSSIDLFILDSFIMVSFCD